MAVIYIMSEMSLSATLKQRALDVGFDLAGVAPLSVWKDLEFARAWVERGFGGEMRYLQNPKRDDPRRVLPSAKSVLCVGLVYNTPLPYSIEERQKLKVEGLELDESGLVFRHSRFGGPCRIPDPEPRAPKGPGTTDNAQTRQSPRAWISRYAWGRDYHAILRAKLEELRAGIEALAPGVETHVYVDTGPVVERAFARFSGIGWMGKNTCLINEGKGSWFFIGVVLTSLQLDPDLPAPDRCGSCTRCLEACPTGALVEPYVMDARRCISYFTIELKGSIPVQFREGTGVNVFGCDICQDVCPWNSGSSHQLSVVGGQERNGDPPSAVSNQPRGVATTDLAEFQPMQVSAGEFAGGNGPEAFSLTPDLRSLTPGFSLFNPPLEALASLTEEDFRRVFAHSPIKRAKYRGWLRNLCVAMGNSGDRRFLPWLERASAHEDPVVREHAHWAAARLRLCG
jgi:epoxyqueuosine reductase